MTTGTLVTHPTAQNRITPIPEAIATEFDSRLEQIRAEINQQRDCSARFDVCIISLEVTTQNIDSKFFRILDHLSCPKSLLPTRFRK
jgi:hypothetical protein